MSCPNPDCPDARELALLRLVLAAVFDLWTSAPPRDGSAVEAFLADAGATAAIAMRQSIEDGERVLRDCRPELVAQILKELSTPTWAPPAQKADA